jgi:hypothetical protein
MFVSTEAEEEGDGETNVAEADSCSSCPTPIVPDAFYRFLVKYV